MRVIIMRLRVEPDDTDTRSDEEIADSITETLCFPATSPLHGAGIGIATLMPDDAANQAGATVSPATE